MKSVEESYCEIHHCDGPQFSRSVFWTCLHRRAWPLALLLGGFGSRFFAADRVLIVAMGKATLLRQVHEEVRYFATAPNSQGWLRGTLKFRVSTRRMINLASAQLFLVEIAQARRAATARPSPPPDCAASVEPFVAAQPASAPAIDSPAGLTV